MSAYYEITVSLRGNHYFSTSKNSNMVSKSHAYEVYRTIKNGHPESEGYSVGVKKWSPAVGYFRTEEFEAQRVKEEELCTS